MSDSENTQKLIASGAELAGAAVGGALGFMAGGPFLAAGAGAVGVAVTKAIGDIANRSMSNREEVKVGATAAYALEKIQEHINKNRVVRDDGFFSRENGRRPDAEEMLEGVLLKGKSEHEELKIKHIGYFYANICFMEKLNSSDANYYLHKAEILTFNQYCILQAFNQLNFEGKDYWTSNKILKLRSTSPELASQIENLSQNNLLTPQATFDVNIKITDMGQKFVSLLSLESIEKDHYGELLAVLNNPPES